MERLRALHSACSGEVRYCLISIVVGFFSLYNAAHYFMEHQIGVPIDHLFWTHWINLTIMLSGVVPLAVPKNFKKSEIMINIVHLINFVVCCVCLAIDIFNWCANELQDKVGPEIIRARQMIQYNFIDAGCCVVGGWISFRILRNTFKVTEISHLDHTPYFVKLGYALNIITLVNLFSLACEKVYYQHVRFIRRIEGSTIDELCWTAINLIAGRLMIKSSNNSALLHNIAFVLVGILTVPSFHYSYYDLKISLSITPENPAFLQGLVSFVVGKMRIAVLIVAFGLYSIVHAETYPIILTSDDKAKFLRYAKVFAVSAAAFLTVTVFSMITENVKRVSKVARFNLQFYLIFLCLSAFAMQKAAKNSTFVATTLVLALIVLKSTYANIVSHVFLPINAIPIYADKKNTTNVTGFVEDLYLGAKLVTLLNTLTLIAIVIFLKTMFNFCRTHVSEERCLTTARKYQTRVTIYGVVMLLVLGFWFGLWSIQYLVDPSTFTGVQQMLAADMVFGKVTIGIFQIVISRLMLKYPIFATAQLILSAGFAADYLTRIDSNHPTQQSPEQTMIYFTEFFSIFFHIMTIASILNMEHVLNGGSDQAESVEIGFHNPVHDEEEDLVRNQENDNNSDSPVLI